MHFAHNVLYAIIAFLAGSLLGTINGFCMFGAWLMGWIFPVPDSIASNDLLAAKGQARSKLLKELPFAWSDRYDFYTDNIGNVTYAEKEPELPYAGLPGE